MISEIDPNYSYADWITSTPMKMLNLLIQIVDYSIDLLDHGFRENLYLRPNFDSGNFSPLDDKFRFGHG